MNSRFMDFSDGWLEQNCFHWLLWLVPSESSVACWSLRSGIILFHSTSVWIISYFNICSALVIRPRKIKTYSLETFYQSGFFLHVRDERWRETFCKRTLIIIFTLKNATTSIHIKVIIFLSQENGFKKLYWQNSVWGSSHIYTRCPATHTTPCSMWYRTKNQTENHIGKILSKP